MLALRKNNTGPYEDPLSIPPESVHGNEELAFLDHFPKPERIVRSRLSFGNIPSCTLSLVILVYVLLSCRRG